MGWIIRYARAGNAEPIYAITHIKEPGDVRFASSVYGVMQITLRPLRSVRVACKEARDEGVSFYLA